MTVLLIAIGHGLFVWFWAAISESKTGAVIAGFVGFLMAVLAGNPAYALLDVIAVFIGLYAGWPKSNKPSDFSQNSQNVLQRPALRRVTAEEKQQYTLETILARAKAKEEARLEQKRLLELERQQSLNAYREQERRLVLEQQKRLNAQIELARQRRLTDYKRRARNWAIVGYAPICVLIYEIFLGADSSWVSHGIFSLAIGLILSFLIYFIVYGYKLFFD